MIRKKHFSASFDFHTGFLTKCCFLLAGFFFFLILINSFLDEPFLVESSTSLGLIVLFLGLGGILWFLHVQFSKLSEIAKEIENSEEWDT